MQAKSIQTVRESNCLVHLGNASEFDSVLCEKDGRRFRAGALSAEPLRAPSAPFLSLYFFGVNYWEKLFANILKQGGF